MNAQPRWTPEQWEKWRINNRRLLSEGFTLHTDFMTNGDVDCYAEKNGVRINREPRRIVGEGHANEHIDQIKTGDGLKALGL